MTRKKAIVFGGSRGIGAAVVAALAGFGGAWAFGQMSDGTGGDGDVAGTGDADLLREQVADLTREIELLKNPPATLGADAPAAVRATSGDQAAVVEAVLEKLDERVARLHLKAFGAKLTELRGEQADYIGVAVDGPYKPDHYRY